MKFFLLPLILIISMNITMANEDFCFTGIEGLKMNSIQKSNKKMSCQDRDSLVVALQAGTLTLGTITALCTWAPEPALTKVSAAVIATGGLILNYATFLVRNSPCNSSEERVLNDYERREFLEKMCSAMDKNYNEYTEKCE
ncbi:hypothetical protein [Halobacteriovorax sp. JY17]|uniref:hypothetical protein n=1 Tax=Halobacteriovorax sp. JY17 TaxID=2014617 RepID=UPI000C46DA82|nr:hypothetical protein [Halobacteriovorax sp. JY17]PIK13903.1 MAG: hypothetical protein CES88_13030 [Halobacteriovorax sp. JY17]